MYIVNEVPFDLSNSCLMMTSNHTYRHHCLITIIILTNTTSYIHAAGYHYQLGILSFSYTYDTGPKSLELVDDDLEIYKTPA